MPVFRVHYPRVTNQFATVVCTEAQTTVRLACLIHAASVHPEPRSNSQNKFVPLQGLESEQL